MDPSDRAVVVPGGNVTYTCVYSTPNSEESILSIQWLVNRSLLEGFNLTNVVSEFIPFFGGIGILFFFDLPLEYNDTCIQCMATLSTGYDITSGETNMLLQGMQCKLYYYSVVNSITSVIRYSLDYSLDKVWK